MSDLGGKFLVEDATGECVSSSIGNRATKGSIVDDDTLQRKTDGSLAVNERGATASAGVDFDNVTRKLRYIVRGALTASDAAAGIFSEENTTGVDLVVVNIWFYPTTGSTAACTVDVGTGSSSSTSYDNYMDGFSVEAGTAGERLHCFTYGDAVASTGDFGTNGDPTIEWAAGEYINASMSTGATAGLVGKYVIEALDLN